MHQHSSYAQPRIPWQSLAGLAVGLAMAAMVAFVLLAAAKFIPAAVTWGLARLDSAPFAYSGRLLDHGAQVNGTCVFQFAAFDREFGGVQLGRTNQRTLEVVKGLFSTELDFGKAVQKAKEPYVEATAQCDPATPPVLLLRQKLSSRRSFDMAGYKRLFDEVSGTEEASSESLGLATADGASSVVDTMYGGTEPPPPPPTPLPGKAGANAVQGHDGTKPGAAMVAAEYQSAYPGEKREKDLKAISGAPKPRNR